MRLDAALAARGDYKSRTRAAEAIKRGRVRVNGKKILSPSHIIKETDKLDCAADSAPVSRAAHKLAHALAHFGFDAKAKTILDIGASTGGFSETLLKQGATRIYAIDVGHDQLAPALQNDPRIINMQGTNARHLSAREIPTPADALVADVSFISLTLALPAALKLIKPQGWLIALVKPQFESAPSDIKKGIIRDEKTQAQACEKISLFLAEQNWQVQGLIESPLTGTKGNREFLIGAIKSTL